MSSTTSTKHAAKIRERRDVKVIPHLKQFAPVWLEKEQVLEDQDEMLFNVVFRHPIYGWVSRRYRYDSFNDVLYYKGQRPLSETEAIDILPQTPYVDSTQSNFPNAAGG